MPPHSQVRCAGVCLPEMSTPVRKASPLGICGPVKTGAGLPEIQLAAAALGCLRENPESEVPISVLQSLTEAGDNGDR